jgi:hypothetical protein
METLTDIQKKTILYAYLDLKGMHNSIVNGSPYDVDAEEVDKTIQELEENFDFIREDKELNG